MALRRTFSSAARLRSSTFFVCEHYNEKVSAGGKVVPAIFDSELHAALQHDIRRKGFVKLLQLRDDSRLSCLLGPIFSRYSQLKYEELDLNFDAKQKLYDPEYLPSRRELLDIFRLRLSPKAYNAGLLPASLDLSLATKQTVYRDLLRFVCHLRDGRAKRYPFPTALNHYCNNIQSTPQPLTSDFVTALASQLNSHIRERGYSLSVPIVEVGAGSGRLAHFLNATKILPVPVVATDVAQGVWQFDPTQTSAQRMHIYTDWRQRPDELCLRSKDALKSQRLDPNSPFRLQLLGARQAIDQLKPVVVLCSWMPNTQNWPLEFAQSESVREFIHIGEMGQCVDRIRFSRFAKGRFATWDKVSMLNLSPSDLSDDWGYSTCVDITELAAPKSRRQELSEAEEDTAVV